LIEQYGPLAKTHGILGAYAQTELGHGSNVAAVETTATFHPKSQEFEIHSPTLTSTKWWIGSGGLVASHAVVQAQLILPRNKRMGPHLFLVQLRDSEDHRLMPGIATGDIGQDISFNACSASFFMFLKSQVQRLSMLVERMTTASYASIM
jgi:acyl-CoA oxidase